MTISAFSNLRSTWQALSNHFKEKGTLDSEKTTQFSAALKIFQSKANKQFNAEFEQIGRSFDQLKEKINELKEKDSFEGSLKTEIDEMGTKINQVGLKAIRTPASEKKEVKFQEQERKKVNIYSREMEEYVTTIRNSSDLKHIPKTTDTWLSILNQLKSTEKKEGYIAVFDRKSLDAQDQNRDDLISNPREALKLILIEFACNPAFTGKIPECFEVHANIKAADHEEFENLIKDLRKAPIEFFEWMLFDSKQVNEVELQKNGFPELKKTVEKFLDKEVGLDKAGKKITQPVLPAKLAVQLLSLNHVILEDDFLKDCESVKFLIRHADREDKPEAKQILIERAFLLACSISSATLRKIAFNDVISSDSFNVSSKLSADTKSILNSIELLPNSASKGTLFEIYLDQLIKAGQVDKAKELVTQFFDSNMKIELSAEGAQAVAKFASLHLPESVGKVIMLIASVKDSEHILPHYELQLTLFKACLSQIKSDQLGKWIQLEEYMPRLIEPDSKNALFEVYFQRLSDPNEKAALINKFLDRKMGDFDASLTDVMIKEIVSFMVSNEKNLKERVKKHNFREILEFSERALDVDIKEKIVKIIISNFAISAPEDLQELNNYIYDILKSEKSSDSKEYYFAEFFAKLNLLKQHDDVNIRNLAQNIYEQLVNDLFSNKFSITFDDLLNSLHTKSYDFAGGIVFSRVVLDREKLENIKDSTINTMTELLSSSDHVHDVKSAINLLSYVKEPALLNRYIKMIVEQLNKLKEGGELEVNEVYVNFLKDVFVEKKMKSTTNIGMYSEEIRIDVGHVILKNSKLEDLSPQELLNVFMLIFPSNKVEDLKDLLALFSHIKSRKSQEEIIGTLGLEASGNVGHPNLDGRFFEALISKAYSNYMLYESENSLIRITHLATIYLSETARIDLPERARALVAFGLFQNEKVNPDQIFEILELITDQSLKYRCFAAMLSMNSFRITEKMCEERGIDTKPIIDMVKEAAQNSRVITI